jgi:AraC family transcriptional regulator, ethanolamine operon transcriptional activator
VLDAEFMQLGSDPIESHVLRVSLDRLVLMRGLENVRHVTRIGGPPDICALALQLEGASATFWRGREVNERTLVSYRPGAEHVGRSSGGMVWTALICEPAVLDDAIRLLHGVEPAQPQSTSTFTESDPAAIHALRDALQQAFLIAEAAPHVLESYAVRRSIEASILAAAIGAIDPQGDRAALEGPLLSHERVVRRAEDTIADRLEAPIYVTDLCEAAGVSERTLRNAFQSVYGMSPIRFLQLRRLHQVRRALRSETAGSVTEAALRYGFGNLGRFAVEYRQLFGESPSLTRRSAGSR